MYSALLNLNSLSTSYFMMRVYHFIGEKYGLQCLREKRMKVARISELNDPFEFMGVDLSNCELRQAMEKMKEDMSAKLGILCFSKIWDSPAQWAHYADGHKGLCLGFEVPDRLLTKIKYCDKRLSADHLITTHKALQADIEAEMDIYLGRSKSRKEYEIRHKKFLEITQQRLLKESEVDEKGLDLMGKILSTKFSHWQYEKEYRVFRELDQEIQADGLYFAKFSDELDLKEVVIGVRSTVAFKKVGDEIGKMANRVDIFKAREDFCKFSMVKNKENSF